MNIDKTKVHRLLTLGAILAVPLLGAGSCLPAPSDRRLKRDITKVGALHSDIDLYRYRYLWSDEAYVGVMAQDLREVRPDAVIESRDGLLAVDYAKLGTRLQTLREWEALAR